MNLQSNFWEVAWNGGQTIQQCNSEEAKFCGENVEELPFTALSIRAPV